MFDLIDAGTLDTVLECSKCGEVLRFDSESLLSDAEFDSRLRLTHTQQWC